MCSDFEVLRDTAVVPRLNKLLYFITLKLGTSAAVPVSTAF